MAARKLLRGHINMVWGILLVASLLAKGDWTFSNGSTTTRQVEALRLDLGLPGGGRLSYRDGLLRIQSPPSETSKGVFEVPWDELKPALNIENKLTPGKGFGAFYTGTEPLPESSFLGLYEGKLVISRESLDDLHAARKKDLRDAGLKDDANKVSDYVLSLDGGAHFLDGFDLRYQGDTSMAFTPGTSEPFPQGISRLQYFEKARLFAGLCHRGRRKLPEKPSSGRLFCGTGDFNGRRARL